MHERQFLNAGLIDASDTAVHEPEVVMNCNTVHHQTVAGKFDIQQGRCSGVKPTFLYWLLKITVSYNANIRTLNITEKNTNYTHF